MINNTTASIDLLGKAYQIKCRENEIPALQRAAEYLDDTLQSFPQGGSNPLAIEKLAMMAALNLASQILKLEEQMSQQMHFLNQRLHNLQTKLEHALGGLEEPSASFCLEVESAQI